MHLFRSSSNPSNCVLTWVLWDWKIVNIHSLTVDNSNKCRGLSLIFIANFMGCLLLICYICVRRLQSLFAFGSQNSNLQSTIKLQSLQPQFQSKHHTPHQPNTQTVSRMNSKCFGEKQFARINTLTGKRKKSGNWDWLWAFTLQIMFVMKVWTHALQQCWSSMLINDALSNTFAK